MLSSPHRQMKTPAAFLLSVIVLAAPFLVASWADLGHITTAEVRFLYFAVLYFSYLPLLSLSNIPVFSSPHSPHATPYAAE